MKAGHIAIIAIIAALAILAGCETAPTAPPINPVARMYQDCARFDGQAIYPRCLQYHRDMMAYRQAQQAQQAQRAWALSQSLHQSARYFQTLNAMQSGNPIILSR